MKTKISLILTLLILLSYKISGQGFTPVSTYFNDDVWFFGTTGVGIQFKNGIAQDLSGQSKVVATENSLSVSTPACDGGFVFYTSHSYVYNTKHKPMKGGIAGNPTQDPGYFYGHNSVADGLAACYIGDNKYFLISSSNAYESGTIQLYYYTVDMNEDNGMGELSNPVMLESAGMSESVEIVPIPDKYNEYWLIYNHIGRREMTVCKITPSGITRQAGLCVTNFNAGSTYQLKRSPTNDRLALASPSGYAYIFNFNPTTGALQYIYPITTGISATYGVEFSPNGQYIFVATWNNPYIKQFSLGASSATQVATGTYHPSGGGGGLKLGPDGKIYVMRHIGSQYVGVIHTPNQVVNFSNTAQYNPNGLLLSAAYSGLALSTGLTPPGIDPPGTNIPPDPQPDYAATTSKTPVTVAVVANDIDPNKADPSDKSGLFLTEAEFLNSADAAKGTVSYDEVSKTVTFTPNAGYTFTEGEQIVIMYRLRNNGVPVGLCSDNGRLTITVKLARLSWSAADPTIEEGGSSTTITVCMPENTAAPSGGLTVTLVPQASSTAVAADYTITPTTLTATIAEGQSCASFVVQAGTDKFVEGNENLVLVAQTPNFTDSPAQTAKILDKTPGDITVEKYTPAVGDASEPSLHGSFRIYFKEANVVCTKQTTVIFSLSGLAQNGVDYDLISTLTAIIPPHTNAVTVPISVKSDYIVEGIRDIIITLVSATN